ncbi:hypothetical protein E2562_025256 [Oryza meyeriana var. granulata]|uniref:Uncharacterized protein n=1 Tax=Oryza meyeriana var. granulata TaxID=110450 RepID=A0A6G1C1I7_9ORYZ|nr:hypothetical protein E2562_025256 [Oryza meyeriana var. granulata]
MARSCFLIVLLLLAVAMGSKLSLAAGESSGGIPTTLGRELREFVSKAGDFLGTARRGAADGWHTAAAAAGDADANAIRASLRSTARRRRARKSAANCIPADMCRKKKVLCGKRCYRSSSGSSLSHIPTTKCVVKCRKCVPTC